MPGCHGRPGAQRGQPGSLPGLERGRERGLRPGGRRRGARDTRTSAELFVRHPIAGRELRKDGSGLGWRGADLGTEESNLDGGPKRGLRRGVGLPPQARTLLRPGCVPRLGLVSAALEGSQPGRQVARRATGEARVLALAF